MIPSTAEPRRGTISAAASLPTVLDGPPRLNSHTTNTQHPMFARVPATNNRTTATQRQHNGARPMAHSSPVRRPVPDRRQRTPHGPRPSVTEAPVPPARRRARRIYTGERYFLLVLGAAGGRVSVRTVCVRFVSVVCSLLLFGVRVVCSVCGEVLLPTCGYCKRLPSEGPLTVTVSPPLGGAITVSGS